MIPAIKVIILCRYSSSRLPGKILKEIGGQSILQHIFHRLKSVFSVNDILVATSTDATDQPIVTYCKDHQIPYFTGDLDNVAHRFLAAAESLNASYAIRINGDNLFVDISLLHSFKMILERNEYDFISNVKNRTYPKGMSIEAVRVTYYRNCFNRFATRDHFEHVTSYLYEHPPENAYYFYNDEIPEAAGIQLAIDTQADFEMAERIFHLMKEDQTNYKLKDIYKFYKQSLNESI